MEGLTFSVLKAHMKMLAMPQMKMKPRSLYLLWIGVRMMVCLRSEMRRRTGRRMTLP
jgi:hypothetical protein